MLSELRTVSRNTVLAFATAWAGLGFLVATRYPYESKSDHDVGVMLPWLAVFLAYISYRRGVLTALRGYLKPSEHLLTQRIAGWAPEYRGKLSSELGAKPLFRAAARWAVTQNFVFRKTWFTLEIACLDELLWHYKGSTQHNINGIDAGTTEHLVLVFTDSILMLPGRETLHGRVGRWLASLIAGRSLAPTPNVISHAHLFLTERCPWALQGYSDEWDSLYKADRDRFAETVLQRRARASAA